jgi:hypothetical protein
MKTPPVARIVRPPTREQMREAFDLYTAAVGRVAHAWNYLHEEMGRLFVRIIESPENNVAASVWYSTFSDRSQRLRVNPATYRRPIERAPIR